MATEGKGVTCDELRAFEQKANELWEQWVDGSDTKDPDEWDAAFESYTRQMEELRVAFGHPPGRPRRRP